MNLRRKISEIIIHCADTPEGRDDSIEDIRRWHKARNFKDVGYHYVIRLDGTLEKGRMIEDVGAHCTGHNAESIGICYIGGKTADMKTPRIPAPTPRRRRCRLSLPYSAPNSGTFLSTDITITTHTNNAPASMQIKNTIYNYG